MNDRAYSYGGTMFHVGLSAAVLFQPPKCMNGGHYRIVAGTGTLWVQPSGATLFSGYPVGASEIVVLKGPAQFYLSATGSTVTVGMHLAFSAGSTL